jgi:hypothetical protein
MLRDTTAGDSRELDIQFHFAPVTQRMRLGRDLLKSGEGAHRRELICGGVRGQHRGRPSRIKAGKNNPASRTRVARAAVVAEPSSIREGRVIGVVPDRICPASLSTLASARRPNRRAQPDEKRGRF